MKLRNWTNQYGFVELNTDGSIVKYANANTADITTETGVLSAVATVFPGYDPVAIAATQAIADAYQAGKYGWMGSANNRCNKKRSLSQTTTDTTNLMLWTNISGNCC